MTDGRERGIFFFFGGMDDVCVCWEIDSVGVEWRFGNGLIFFARNIVVVDG